MLSNKDSDFINLLIKLIDNIDCTVQKIITEDFLVGQEDYEHLFAVKNLALGMITDILREEAL